MAHTVMHQTEESDMSEMGNGREDETIRADAAEQETRQTQDSQQTSCGRSKGELTIRIDTRYNRIHLHRQTLKAIGNPEFVHLGYLARTKSLMVLGTWVNEQKAIRLRFAVSGACYVHSKKMIEGIRSVSGVLMEQGSYLLHAGDLADKVPAVSFPLEKAELLLEEEPEKQA